MGAEGVEPLGEVAEDDRHDLDNHVGDRGVDVQSADEQSQPEVVDADIDRDDLCVAEKLLGSVDAGVSERDVAGQIEPGEEGDDEGDEERQNRCRNDDEPEIGVLLAEHEVVAEPVKNGVETEVHPADKGVTEGLLGNESPQGPDVEKVCQSDEQVTHGAKVRFFRLSVAMGKGVCGRLRAVDGECAPEKYGEWHVEW